MSLALSIPPKEAIGARPGLLATELCVWGVYVYVCACTLIRAPGVSTLLL